MITLENIEKAKSKIREWWPETAEAVISACEKAEKFDGNTGDFLKHCTCCGGNWGGMFLTGIRELWPEVWDAIPDDMGVFAFSAIGYVLQLCGVDTSK